MIRYNLIVIEGMSTSGKTTVMTMLSNALKAKWVDAHGFEERRTMSRDIFTHVDPQKSLKEMRDFLVKECSNENRVIICDRFHVSHMAITKGSHDDFNVIEKEISNHKPLLVFLTIPEEKVKDRLLNSKSHRDDQWQDELRLRGETEEAAIEWFKGTQRSMYTLFEASTLPKISFDTEKTSFEEIVSNLVQKTTT